MNLLVTGAAGFIGTNFVRYWTRHHPTDRVVALDALTYAGNPVNLDDVRHRIHFVRADIGDLSTATAGSVPAGRARPVPPRVDL